MVKRSFYKRKNKMLYFFIIFLVSLASLCAFFFKNNIRNKKVVHFEFMEFKFPPSKQEEEKIIGLDKQVYSLISKIKKKKI